MVPPKIPLCHEAIGSIRDAVEPQGLRAIALAVAEARSVDLVLQRIVDGRAGQPGIALARIWLIARGDICSSCLVRAECPDQAHCLHLLASAGRSVLDPGDNWARLTGDFRRVPLHVWRVGRIGGTGKPMLITDDLETDPAIVRPEWAKTEGIMAFLRQVERVAPTDASVLLLGEPGTGQRTHRRGPVRVCECKTARAASSMSASCLPGFEAAIV